MKGKRVGGREEGGREIFCIYEGPFERKLESDVQQIQ